MKQLPSDAKLQLAIDDLKILTAKVLVNQSHARGLLPNLPSAEFKVFSQWGDDGIIQYLIHLLDVTPHTFIEFGVENYEEANTRFLLLNNNWAGLVIDSNPQHIESILGGEYYWRHQLSAVCSFVTRENINQLFTEHGFAGPIGILSIDIDGNDFWIWEAITVVEPVIVIIEYNSVFGCDRAVTIPYDPTFNRTDAHYSNLYFGASLKALCLLAAKKGYSFIGSNSAGNNAYFVRTDQLGPLHPLTAQEGYVTSRFRESQYLHGGNSYITGQKRLAEIAHLAVLDIEQNAQIPINELLTQHE